MNIKAQLEKKVGKNRVIEHAKLTSLTTLKTTAEARYFFEARSRDDLVNAKKASLAAKTPLFILGGGSNLVILENEINTFVVHNRYVAFEVIKNTNTETEIAVSSGFPVNLLVQKTVDLGLAGFEYQLGLPGTVGGAIYMNSKWTHPPSYFGDNLLRATLVDAEGQIKKVDRDYFEFGYDFSKLQQTHEMVLEAVFRLKKIKTAELRARSQDALTYRKQTQPFGVFSSGCFFRNISVEQQKKYELPTTSAGYLIDKAGLKGTRVGNYYVSSKHANFIINKGEGNPQDLLSLVKLIKEKVYEKFGINLEEEVIVV